MVLHEKNQNRRRRTKYGLDSPTIVCKGQDIKKNSSVWCLLVVYDLKVLKVSHRSPRDKSAWQA